MGFRAKYGLILEDRLGTDICNSYYIKVTLNELRKKYLDKKSLAPKSMQHRHEVLIDKCNKRKSQTHRLPLWEM